jgi:hypothetical protein
MFLSGRTISYGEEPTIKKEVKAKLDNNVNKNGSIANGSSGESEKLAEIPPHWKTYPERERHETFFRDVFELILNDAMFEGIQR